MRAELRALARQSPHPAVPARPRKRGSPAPRGRRREGPAGVSGSAQTVVVNPGMAIG